MCHGGWPQIAHDKDDEALDLAYDYVDAIVNKDISRTDGVQRSPEYARLLLSEYARNTATMASLNSMRANVAARGREISRPTADAYLAALRRAIRHRGPRALVSLAQNASPDCKYPRPLHG